MHLPYHQERLERSLEASGIDARYPLASLLTPPESGCFRCRFLYDGNHFAVEYHPYTPKSIRTLKPVFSDSISYPLKSTDRQALDLLFAQREECDDVVIVKNGFLSDTTIANIALKIDGRWFTPDTPLLRGTTRERLIQEGWLIPVPLRLEDISKAQAVAVMNAMLGFVEVENGIIL